MSRTFSRFTLVCVCVLAALSAACSGGGGADGAASEAPADSPIPQPTPASPDTEDDGGDGSAALTEPCNLPHRSEVVVADAAALRTALSDARAGTLIRLAPGIYAGRYTVEASGTADDPIVVCGGRDSVLDGGSVQTGYVFHFKNVSHWVLSGLTITRGKNGVMLDASSDNLLTGLAIHDVGQSAVHFRRNSSDNVLSYSAIRDTGLYEPGYGEGVYIGSAVGNWAEVMGAADTPDRSDRNRVLNNTIGPGVAAEHVDVKEGTSDGLLRGNVFDGTGLSGVNSGDSWVDVKGNGYRIAANTGRAALRDGFQLHVRVGGWGRDNVFEDNIARVDADGYGFALDRGGVGNVVRCDNIVERAGAGYADVACTP